MEIGRKRLPCAFEARPVVTALTFRLLWGGMAVLVAWLVTSQIYRSNKRGSVSSLLSGEMDEMNRLRKAAMEKIGQNRGQAGQRARGGSRSGQGTARSAGETRQRQ